MNWIKKLLEPKTESEWRQRLQAAGMNPNELEMKVAQRGGWVRCRICNYQGPGADHRCQKTPKRGS